MNGFYSIVKICPNIAVEDSIAIGVVLFDGSKFRYHFSDKKKRVAARLLAFPIKSLTFYTKQLTIKCEELNQQNQQLDKGYFDYLHQYSNGILQFSSPNPIVGLFNDEQFLNLINVLFDHELVETIDEFKETDTILAERSIQDKLIEPIHKKVHTNYTFTPSRFPDIYFSIKMECIGRNGALIGARHQNFELNETTLDKHLSHYLALIPTLSNKYKQSLAKNKFYLIAEEPTRLNSPQYKIWDAAHKNELLTIIHPNEVAKIASEIEEKKAGWFLEDESKSSKVD